MNPSFRIFRQSCLALILGALVCVSYAVLLGGQFLYDDLRVVVGNADLHRVKTFADCFSFVFKPTRPVSDWFLALGEWAGRGQPVGQRFLSILVHAVTVVLVYFNLEVLIQRVQIALPRYFSFCVAFLFALSPIHSEAIAIAQYRMELLGSCFTLLAVLATQGLFAQTQRSGISKFILYGILFSCLGLASLSKETFYVTSFLLVLLFSSVEGISLGFLKNLCLFQLFWGLVLLVQLERDATTAQPYGDLIGYGVISVSAHIRLAARALLEGLNQMVTGRGLTITRLSERASIFSRVGVLPSILFLVAVFCAWIRICIRKSTAGSESQSVQNWMKIWSSVLVISGGIYLAIPNINIGSEHYWYLSVAALLSILGVGAWRLLSRVMVRPEWAMLAIIIVCGASHFSALEHRLQLMLTRESFYIAELEAHPESAGSWIDRAASILETPGREAALRARPFLERARQMDPQNATLLSNEFISAVQLGDDSVAGQLMEQLRRNFIAKPGLLAGYYLYWGKAALEKQNCARASGAISDFNLLKPNSVERKNLQEDYFKTCGTEKYS